MGSKLVFCSIFVIGLAIGWYAIFREKPLEPLPNIEDKWWGEGERKKESADVRPFTVDIPSEVLFDLKKKLKSTRYFKSLENSEWVYGTKPEYMKEVVDHWLNKYSWGSHQLEINKYPHFKTDIDGISLHFIHVKPDKTKTKGKTVCPLLLLHGWPGSFHEFHKTIPLFTKVEEDVAFEVIVPSLPGYGFSSAARKKGLNPVHIAKIMHKLMIRLGFENYYVQGGDWGSDISRKMAILFPRTIKGLHMNFFPLVFHPKYPISTLLLGMIVPTWLEPDSHERKKAFSFGPIIKMLLEETGYFHIQATKPDTVGLGLNDSPAGLASYIIEKFSVTSGCPPNASLGCMEKHFTKDEVLTNIMIYWVTGSMASAMRLYKEAVHDPHIWTFRRPITVPVGYAEFPFEGGTPPKSWVKAICPNLVSYTIMPKGGHFAAFGQPELFANDVRSFVVKVEQMNPEKGQKEKS